MSESITQPSEQEINDLRRDAGQGDANAISALSENEDTEAAYAALTRWRESKDK